MAVPKSVKLAVVLALYTYPDSKIGEDLPKSAIDLARDEGLIGVLGDGGIYMTDAGRERMMAIMEAIE